MGERKRTPGSRQIAAHAYRAAPARRFADEIVDFLGQVPASAEPAGPDPRARARAIAQRAAGRAALAAGGLALPPGPLGWLTVLPELVAVWRLQAQMVADIAAAHGQRATLSREQMLYCLFRHTAAQALRDVVARVGGRWVVQKVPLATLQRIAAAIGLSLTRRTLRRGVSRWFPLVGAVGVGAYAYYDTRQVANTAIELFAAGPLVIDSTAEPVDPDGAA